MIDVVTITPILDCEKSTELNQVSDPTWSKHYDNMAVLNAVRRKNVWVVKKS